jgi:hypothetical protein
LNWFWVLLEPNMLDELKLDPPPNELPNDIFNYVCLRTWFFLYNNLILFFFLN